VGWRQDGNLPRQRTSQVIHERQAFRLIQINSCPSYLRPWRCHIKVALLRATALPAERVRTADKIIVNTPPTVLLQQCLRLIAIVVTEKWGFEGAC
jgi:hypothetical protein